jgi:hypothetical protein
MMLSWKTVSLPNRGESMAWPTVTKTEEMFKPASTVAQHKTGLKVLAYGEPDTMKTGFALSFPAPIYIFDTELGSPPLFQYYKDKEIHWCDATFLNPQTGLHDASVALQNLETGITLLKDVKAGTVVIDSGTDVILSAQSLYIRSLINKLGTEYGRRRKSMASGVYRRRWMYNGFDKSRQHSTYGNVNIKVRSVKEASARVISSTRVVSCARKLLYRKTLLYVEGRRTRTSRKVVKTRRAISRRKASASKTNVEIDREEKKSSALYAGRTTVQQRGARPSQTNFHVQQRTRAQLASASFEHLIGRHWDWIQEWLNEIGKHKEGQLLRFEWAKAKLKWKKLLLQLMAKPLHFVMTAQPQEIYANKEPTGVYRPRVQGESAHSFDIVLHMMRWETVNPKDLTRTVRYVTEVTKCRFKRAWRPTFEDIGINGFEKLTAKLKEDLGIEVW